MGKKKKKDRSNIWPIITGIVVIVIVIVIMAGQLFWIKNTLNLTTDNNIVQTLIGFYSSLFTAVAVIVAIAAMFGWRRIQELSDKLEQFKEIQGKVDFMGKRPRLG